MEVAPVCFCQHICQWVCGHECNSKEKQIREWLSNLPIRATEKGLRLFDPAHRYYNSKDLLQKIKVAYLRIKPSTLKLRNKIGIQTSNSESHLLELAERSSSTAPIFSSQIQESTSRVVIHLKNWPITYFTWAQMRTNEKNKKWIATLKHQTKSRWVVELYFTWYQSIIVNRVSLEVVRVLIAS